MRKIYSLCLLMGFLLFLTTDIFSQSNENNQISKDYYTKFSFITYGLKSKEQALKLESDYRLKSGILFVKIDFKTKESIIVIKGNIKVKDIGEVARMADCKIDNITSAVIDKVTLEALSTKH